MTNQEAIRILDEQRNKFMDEWVDFGGVNEAYNMAIQALKKQDAVKPKYKERVGGFFTGLCPTCGTALNNVLNVKACGKCGQELKWND